MKRPLRILNTFASRIIFGAAIIGGIYGLVISPTGPSASISAWSLVLPTVCGAALCACGASALCRFVTIFNLIRKRLDPTDDVARSTNGSLKSDVSAIDRRPNPSSNPSSMGHSSPVQLLICNRLDRLGKPRSVRRQQLSQDKLKDLLDEVLKDSVLQ